MATPSLRWTGPHNQEEVYPLDADQIVIGRTTDANIHLTDLSVSRSHAKIVRDEEGFSIVDLNSRQGTYVNGHQVEQQRLRHGDRIRLGKGRMEFLFVAVEAGSAGLAGAWKGSDLDTSIENLTSILPPPNAGYSDLKKISCILDFQYYWGKSFSPEKAFQQILRSALEISGAERGFILLKQQEGFEYSVGMDGDGRTLLQSEFSASRAVVSRVASEGKAVFMTERITGEFAGQESILVMHLTAVACLPLEAISSRSDTPEVLGILYLDSTKKMHSLSGLDQKILNKLAEEAGNVFEKLEMIKSVEERKKMEQELALAEETQKSLLPQSLPEFPNFGIDAYSKPTRYVGGDFYDFLPLNSKKLLGMLADVSGKGISAALLGSLLQGALEVEFRSATKPEEALNRVNKFLCEKTQPDRFVTLFLFVLNSQGKGQFISAGHNPAYLFRAATGKVEELASDGFILGAFPFASYSSRPFQLRKGDILLVYSDGLTEAQNHEEEIFGEERLLEIIQREAPAGGEVLKKKILEALAHFTHGMAQTDDITFLLIDKQR